MAKLHGNKLRSIAIQIFAISLVSFILGEATLRVYHYFSPSYLFRSDSYNKQFRGKPFASVGKFQLNSLGFQDKEFLPKAHDGYRIVALGDSFAFGVVPYDQNYLTLIEAELQRHHPSLDLLNMGIAGTGPPDYYQLLIDEGLAFEPDLVLLSFFIGNDFVGTRRRRLYEYSYVTTLFHRAWRIVRGYRGPIIRASKTLYCDDCPTMTEDRFLQVERSRGAKYVRGNNGFARSMDRALSYLEKIRLICSARGIDFVVVLIPDELQINRELQKLIQNKFFPDLDASFWDSSLPNRALSGRLTQLGIDHIDLYDAFVATSSQTRLYKPRDTHWNIAGNRLAANLIADHLPKYLK